MYGGIRDEGNVWQRESRGKEIMLVSCRTETKRSKDRAALILNRGLDSSVSCKQSTDMRQI